ncbi:MAG TPA: glycosyltransferase family 4 protein [Thermoanaerobaculia bacterium]
MTARLSGAPKRILFVGAEAAFFVTHRLPLAIAARAAGYDVHVATPRGRLLEKILEHGFPWHEVVMQRKTNVVREARSVPNLVLLYRRVRPDLVHHIAIKAVLYGTIAARIARVPAVVNAVAGLGYAFDDQRARSPLGRALSIAFSTALRHPRMRVIFQNVEDREVFLRRGWIAADQATLIRGSGVDTDLFTPAPAPPPAPPLVVLASRLLASKGVAEFVEAARIVRASGVPARFAIVGEPDPDNPETITREQLDAWGREGFVETWGRRGDMHEVLREATLFALPTYYREGVPKALIEAASSGVPAITTDTPGCRDIVANGETGLLVPPRDANALADAVLTLLRDDEVRARMSRAARARVLAHFSLQGVIEDTLAIYRDLLA